MKKFNSNLLRSIFLLSSFSVASNVYSQPLKNDYIEINYDTAESTVLNQNAQMELVPDEAPGQYFLVRSGVKVNASSEYRSTTVFYGIVPNRTKTCTAKNFYDSSFIIGSNFSSAEEKKKTFNSCIKFKVEDLQKGTLEYEPVQENCIVEKINDSTAIISAGDCFFKNVPGQTLSVEIQPEPNCADKNFLSKNNLSPSELFAEWSAYIYPSNTIGFIFRPKGKAIWKKDLFLNLNPGDTLLKVVKKERDEKLISRPGVFVFPDFMLSNFSINNKLSSVASYVDIGLLISSFGAKDICEAGICSTYGNYDFPFAPYLTLFEINARRGKKEELKSFFMGDRLAGKWNGTFNQRLHFSGIHFEIGKKYSIELSFSDPAISYSELKKYFTTSLRLGSSSIGLLGDTEFRSLPSLGTIGGLAGNIGTLDGLNDRRIFGGIIGIADNLIPRIMQTLDDPTFPPDYSIVCNKNMTKCQNANLKEHVKLSINFQVKSIGEDGRLVLEGIQVKRTGNLLTQYETNFDENNKPMLDCGNAGL